MLGGKTPVTVLQEYLQKRFQIPTYTLIYSGGDSHKPQFKYEVAVESQTAYGDGKSKKEAKHNAAKNMVDLLNAKEIVENELCSNIQSPYADVVKDNAVGALLDYCVSRNLPSPTYLITRDEGLSHAKVFCMKVTVSSLSEQAEARTKKQAKQLAAGKLLDRLKVYLRDNIEEIATVTFPDKFDEVNETATKKLIESSGFLKNQFFPSQHELLGLKIADYHKVLENSMYLSSPTLDSIKGLNEQSVRKIENVKETFEKIMSEGNFEYKFECIPVINKNNTGVILHVLSSPTWSFFGCGSTNDEANLKACQECLVFLVIMRS